MTMIAASNDRLHEMPDRRSSSFGPAPCAFVRLFKPQFVGLVLSGEKCQTVRPVPKRMPKPGDRISLRCWAGNPYRSKQRILRDAEISRVEFVEIGHDRIVIEGRKLTPHGEWSFAKADGFNTPQDMLEWFNVTHGLPFIGVVICWQNDLSSATPPASARHNETTANEGGVGSSALVGRGK